MRIALLGDTHFGVRNDSVVFHDYFKKFYDEVFFPYLVENNITHFIQVGDLFDRRKYINFNTLFLCREYFFNRLQELNLHMVVFAGNHDIFYKNTLKINSLDLLLNEYKANVTVIQQPSDYFFDMHKVILLPWICEDNAVETFETMNQSSSQICIGHLELGGFEMYKGTIHNEGMDATLFNKFDMVLSGHYHHKSSRGNIHYLGTPYEMTWSDYNDPKGFHILDLKTRELSFVENPYRIFHKIHYDDSSKRLEDILEMDVSAYAQTYVKAIVKEKTNPYWFDMFIEKLEKSSVVNIQVVEDHLNLNLEVDEDILDEAKDTPTTLRAYVENLELDTDKDSLINLLNTLYNEALMVE